MHSTSSRRGFTLLELLVVIAIIGIISGIVITALDESRFRANRTAAISELNDIYKAIYAARLEEGQTLMEVTGSNCSDCPCRNIGDLKENSPVGEACYDSMHASFVDINNASGGILKAFIQDENIRDPWGSPYIFDENEGEPSHPPCTAESIRSVGPDGLIGGGDDITISIEPISTACH